MNNLIVDDHEFTENESLILRINVKMKTGVEAEVYLKNHRVEERNTEYILHNPTFEAYHFSVSKLID